MASSEDASDLARLWEEAIADFKGSTKLDLTQWHFKSMDEAMDSAKQQSQNFSGWRHDRTKVDHVRSLLGNNLNNIQKVVTGAKMAADAAGAFPPALPATLLMTAFTVVFQTFKDVKADYDRVCGFYTQMGSFFDQISMVENKSPKLEPFERCIRKVFSAMLTIAGIAADYKSKGRFKKWAKNLVDGGGDPKLASAYGTMDDSIVKLHQAVGLATLSVLVDVQEVTTRIEGKTDQVLVSQQEIKAISVDTHRDVSSLREGQEETLEEIGGLRRVMSTGFEDVTAQNQQLHADLKKMMNDALKQSAAERKVDANSEKSGKSEVSTGSRRYKNAKVKRHFSDGAEARNFVRAQRGDISESFVEGTTKWIFEDDTYKSWSEGEVPALWLAGEAGTGKSFLAHAIAANLEQRQREHASVASFFFREDQDALRSLRNALRCAVLQIADSNPAYLEVVAAEIAKQSADDDPWSQFFASRFPRESQAHLYFVVDGVDEAHVADQEAIVALIQQLPTADLNIHVLFTGRPSLETLFANSAPVRINLSKERISADMKLLTAARIRSLPRLRKFHRQTKRQLEQKLGEKADSMLYIEHMLRRFSSIGREGAVLKDLKKGMPDSLKELYKLLLAECQKGRTHAQYVTLKTLFAVLAYSERPLSLGEAADLVTLTDPDDAFDIEDEVIGRCARLLDLSQDQDETDDNELISDLHSDGNDASDSDHVADVSSEREKTRIAFQERSMRDYFRAVNVEEDGLRTSTAHSHLLIFKLLVQLLSDEAPQEVIQKPCLHAYAANYWADHFVKIDVSAKHVSEVLGGLSSIFTNENNAAASFESYKAPYYDCLEQRTGFLAKFESFLQLVDVVDDLPATLKDWAEESLKAPRRVLLPLARGHISNQFDPLSRRLVEQCFLYSRSALITAGVFTAGEDEKLDIVSVLEYFPDIDSRSVHALRGIAHVLQRRNQLELSEEYASKALALDDPSPRNRFKLHWISSYNKYFAGYNANVAAAESTGGHDTDSEVDSGKKTSEQLPQPAETTSSVDVDVQAASGAEQNKVNNLSPATPGKVRLEEALQHTNTAMTLLPEGWRDDEKWVVSVESIYTLKAGILRLLQREDEALAAYHDARAVRPEVDNLMASILNAMLNMWQCDLHAGEKWAADAVHPEQYFDIIESWTLSERLKWVTFLIEVDLNQGAMSGWALQKCAKRAGTRGHRITINVYEAYLRSVSRTSSKWAQAKGDLALIYSLSVGDLQKACDTAIEVLSVEYSEDDTENLETVLFNVRQNLCDDLFTLFRQSGDPQRKLKLLDTMMNLPIIKIGTADDATARDEAAISSWEELNESPVLVMQALMTRTIGSPVKFREMMERLFQICVAGLTDKVGNNDSSSFRLLAKALACVPGLQRDAQIALSCQYSVTDPEVEHPDENEGREDDDEEAEQRADESEDNDTIAGADVDEHQAEQDGPTVGVTVNSQAVEITQPQLDELTTQLAAEVEKLTVNGDSIGIPPKDSLESQAYEENEEDAEREDEDILGDLLPEYDRGATCDGNCDFFESDWTQGVMYMCVHCANCDLCEDCYEKRMAWNRGVPNTIHWTDWCGQDHAYVKGPVEGWRGVKNGVIRIGEEEVEFKEWLRLLKEERWPKAWEDFWRGESFLRAGS
ncbi:glyoxalase bleomycin resistance dioxygenase [Lecanosticta acicola]|uniref:Glyoxalase bleomycin resistance dioxygenase n=1 Tax=Lecanosticta acicola TaxID=111012 RepID=A0AAI8YZ53_9PEZI|nr:glyoxalase bleomycin resistance dioxygenase [Lecanosticta acicola]